ncbi:MAG: type II toxin-antitoxin system VapC family toxin [Verrucomicrobiota bacterium]
MQVVIDASYSGAWFIPDERTEEADEISLRIEKEEIEFCCPSLWDFEMMNLLLISVRRGRVAEENLQWGIGLLHSIKKTSFDASSEAAKLRLADFGQRFQLTAYDAAYLELADRFNVPLFTKDNKLAAAGELLGLPTLD